MSLPSSAIQLVSFDSKRGQYYLPQEAENFLSSLTEPLAIISIVGKYRTGKSFLVNKVLLPAPTFQVGPTINACTKGLWICRELIPTENPDYPNLNALVIDTEGLGGIEESENHDTRIFLITLLISSYLIYNSVGSIDEQALQNLSLIVNLAKDIASKNKDIQCNFPFFLWVLRDFALQLESFGEKITAKQYLDRSLEEQKGVSEAMENKNKTRRLIKAFFQERDCVTMVRPIEEEEKLQNLQQWDKQLRGKFIEDVNQVKGKVLKKAKPKTMNGQILNGQQILNLIRVYLEMINKGAVPDMQYAWTHLLSDSVKQAIKSKYRIFKIQKAFGQQQQLSILDQK